MCQLTVTCTGSSPLQHEEASVKMFDHLVEDNKLEPLMKKHGLQLPQDLLFIKEQIAGPSCSDADSSLNVGKKSV